MKLRLLIMAGGTGGHLFPALAVADALREQGVEVAWLGSRGGMEERLIPRHNYPLYTLTIRGLRGKGIGGWLMAPLQILRALVQAWSVLRRFRPHVVLGMGGFASGPGGVAARLSGIPLVIHEQNAVAGLTNRLLAHFALLVLTAFPAILSRHQPIVTGNPLRRAIGRGLPLLLPPQEPLHLLVLGGSLGAATLNRAVAEAVALIPAAERPTIRHQCGEGKQEQTEAHYRTAGVTATIEPFIENMAEAYRWADWILCRAGALTVAEVAEASRAALFVPYPHAVDNHQEANAACLVAAGGAKLLREAELSTERLAAEIHHYSRDPAMGRSQLRQMGAQAHLALPPQATERVAGLVLSLLKGQVAHEIGRD